MKKENIKVWRFALLTCLICGLILSVSFVLLKQRQEMNIEMDQKIHILKVVGLKNCLKKDRSPEEILDIYKNFIQEMAVNSYGLSVAVQQQSARRIYVYYEKGRIISYCFPIKGKGLWSTIEGYIALDADVETIRGITFSKHGETPGLGGEIEEEWFEENFVGKRIFDVKINDFVAIDVLKGKAVEALDAQKTFLCSRRYYRCDHDIKCC